MDRTQCLSGVRAEMIGPDQEDDEEAEGAQNDGERLLSVFRNLHYRQC